MRQISRRLRVFPVASHCYSISYLPDQRDNDTVNNYETLSLCKLSEQAQISFAIFTALSSVLAIVNPSVRPSVCLSVRLSHAGTVCVKTTQATIMRSSLDVTDRRADGRRTYCGITALCVASRGNKNKVTSSQHVIPIYC